MWRCIISQHHYETDYYNYKMHMNPAVNLNEFKYTFSNYRCITVVVIIRKE